MTATVTPDLYNSIYSRKDKDNFLNRLDSEAIGDKEIASLQCTGFLSKGDLARYKRLVRQNLPRNADPGQSILLDLGCGFGRLGCWLARELNLRLIGIDFSSIAIAKAQTLQNGHSKVQPRFKVADFSSTGLPSSSVCAVVSLDALYMSSTPAQVLREIHRILIPDGALLFTAYLQDSQKLPTGPKRGFDWTVALKDSGFRLVHCQEITARWRSQMRVKHERRLELRDRIKSELGALGEAELAVSESILGLNGKPSYLSHVSRFEIVAKPKPREDVDFLH